ncbi:YcnI family protein [Mesorhizobium sp. VK4C]|uniref:YcnI family copper-binding membrane protein n=1 Tax=Mesorhizobium captivum TaxID=3072319 RepID=UPI002A23D70F|nr:YcnI family protein [Mesorhizobium sp. VK4C]MDX8500013.1 YcnI family protein [Mesorhizobium sp. VK4C]
MKKYLLAVGALCALGTNAALAHITLETQEAAVGSTYKAILRVPHGCEGKATTAVRVQIPEGVISVKPMPKPGWTLQTKKGRYEKSYQLYGETLTTGVKEVDWSGGNLPDDFYDEFVFRASLAADLPAGHVLYFPVVQECGDAAARWIEIPAAGQDEDALENPAPGIKLLPKK